MIIWYMYAVWKDDCIQLNNTSITSHNYFFFFLVCERSTLSKFQAYSTELSNIVTKLYIRSPELIHLKTGSSYTLAHLPISPTSLGIYHSALWFYEALGPLLGSLRTLLQVPSLLPGSPAWPSPQAFCLSLADSSVPFTLKVNKLLLIYLNFVALQAWSSVLFSLLQGLDLKSIRNIQNLYVGSNICFGERNSWSDPISYLLMEWFIWSNISNKLFMRVFLSLTRV